LNYLKKKKKKKKKVKKELDQVQKIKKLADRSAYPAYHDGEPHHDASQIPQKKHPDKTQTKRNA
jgi:hypothetical protein